MVVGSLRHRRPQHQGQTEPSQPSQSKPHAFLHWAILFTLIGCVAQGNAAASYYGNGLLCSAAGARALAAIKLSEETHVRTNLRRTQSPIVAVGEGSRNQETQRRPHLQGRRERRRQRLRSGPFSGHTLLRTMEPSARRRRRHKEIHG